MFVRNYRRLRRRTTFVPYQHSDFPVCKHMLFSVCHGRPHETARGYMKPARCFAQNVVVIGVSDCAIVELGTVGTVVPAAAAAFACANWFCWYK